MSKHLQHPFTGNSRPSKLEQKTIAQVRAEKTVVDGVTGLGAYTTQRIADLHEYSNDVYTNAANHILRDRSDLEPRPRVAVETFSGRQAEILGHDVLTTISVASEQAIDTVGRSKYPEPDPPGWRKRLTGG